MTTRRKMMTMKDTNMRVDRKIAFPSLRGETWGLIMGVVKAENWGLVKAEKAQHEEGEDGDAVAELRMFLFQSITEPKDEAEVLYVTD